jgi:two-component system, cell cycle sensor histidine kinase and response regulator CckA
MSCSGVSRQHWILAIDDELAILDIVKTALKAEGYTVHIASSPTEGIKFYEQHWRNIKLVLIDFMMPEMTGDLVFEHLQRINPDVRVLLLTGSFMFQKDEKFVRRLRGYMEKPINLDILAVRVKDAIDSP